MKYVIGVLRRDLACLSAELCQFREMSEDQQKAYGYESYYETVDTLTEKINELYSAIATLSVLDGRVALFPSLGGGSK